MKVGFVTDTHYGVREDERVEETLEWLVTEFERFGVDTVVHLGDIAHEHPIELYSERVEQVIEPFVESDAFDFHMTLGNHDIEVFSESDFEGSFQIECNQVIARENGTSVVKVNTASTADLPGVSASLPVGRLSDAARDCIMDELYDGQDVFVCTHYPIQYTELYQEQGFFDVRPEYTFPINKIQFEQELADSYVEPNIEGVCGHLHPEHSTTVETEPFGIPLHVLEPVQLFEQEGSEIVWKDNLEPTVSDLVFEF